MRIQILILICFYCKRIEKSIQLTWEINSTDRVFFASNILSPCLYILYITPNIQLIRNICDCIFHCAALSYCFELCLLRRFYYCMYGRFPPIFHLVIKSSKTSIQPKSFAYFTSYSTSNPTDLPWLITKALWWICSTSCCYEPKVTSTSLSQRS